MQCSGGASELDAPQPLNKASAKKETVLVIGSGLGNGTKWWVRGRLQGVGVVDCSPVLLGIMGEFERDTARAQGAEREAGTVPEVALRAKANCKAATRLSVA